jgi:glycosidase
MRVPLILELLFFCGSAATLACGCHSEPSDAPVPARDCSQTVWVLAPGAASVSLSGDWNGWTPSTPVPSAGQGWFKTVLALPPGEHGYLVDVDGKPQLDDRNPLTTFHGEQEVSLFLAQDCSEPLARVDAVEADVQGNVTLRATFLASQSGAALHPASVRGRFRDGTELKVEGADPKTGTIALHASGLPQGRHTVTLKASDASGKPAAAARAGVWVRAVAPAWHDGLLYQIVLDRFRGDGGAVLKEPATAGSRAGGTLDGVRAEIENGTFDQLGVGVLWLSPVYLNPDGLLPGSGGHMYESYHGYWPVDDRKVDPRLGGEQALDALIAAAHSRGIRVLIDVVPNHVFETNARYTEHETDGWFHDKCVCGQSECPWSTHIESCWFTEYLPDYRFQEPGAMLLAVQDAIWWHDRFDLDGVRIDAVPMMPRATTRRIAQAVRATWAPRDDKFLLGEVFTGAGESGIAGIRYFMGPDGLDSAFDFPLMWAMRSAIATNKSGFDAIESVLHDTEVALEGSGAVLGRIIGNHDTSRFLSEAVGDGGGDPWAVPAVQPDDAEPYQKQAMAMALMLTLPGMPVIYYGDETGLAGAGDPDCRRVMPSLDALSPPRKLLLEQTRRLARLRACSQALRRGARAALTVKPDTYAWLRDVGDGWPVVIAMSKAATDVSVEVSGNVLPPGVYLDVMSSEQVPIGTQGAAQAVLVKPLSARVLVRADSPCSF